MEELQRDLNKTKEVYKTVFLQARNAIDAQLEMLKKNYLCTNCTKNCSIEFSKISLFQSFPENCNYKNWQKASLKKLCEQISKDIYLKIQQMNSKRKNYQCARCASCCRMASSEFTYEELKEKAKSGDKFAKEFVETFIPYENNDIPRQIYPEYVALLEDKFDENIQFYHCPKLGKDGLCTDYENRPSICRSFPENPLAALPPKCGFRDWKDETEVTALLLHAMVEIVGFYIENLKKLCNTPKI